MEWEEISRRAFMREPMPDDATAYEIVTYQGLIMLYVDLKRHKGTVEEARIRNTAEQFKGEFLRTKSRMNEIGTAMAAYKLMKQHPDLKCREVLEMIGGTNERYSRISR